MFEVRQTAEFAEWLSELRDRRARLRVTARIRRVGDGNLGDVRSVGDGVSELRVDYGPGYRLYFVRRGRVVIVLLCGGDKSTQGADIAMAKSLAQEV